MERCLIIGGDAGGMSAAMQIRRRRPDFEVTVLEKGAYTSYAACGMPYVVAGDVSSIDDLEVVRPREFLEKRGIDLHMHTEALAIDLSAREVRSRGREGERTFGFDRLLLATGAEPIRPPWPGTELPGVTGLRHLDDLRGLLARLDDERPKRVVVVGAGYVGLEMAEAFCRRGLEVTVLEKMDGVMGGAEPKLTALVADELFGRGIRLLLGTTVEGFEGKTRLEGVRTDTGVFPADLAIVALGVRPRTKLARDAGLALGAGDAIHVDDHQRTSAPNVFAAGDCTDAFHRVLGKSVYVPLALGANRAGRVAGANMAGGDDRFPGIVGSAVTRVCELAIGRTGVDEATANREGIPVHTTEVSAPHRAHYMSGHQTVWVKLVYRSDDHRLIGATLAGRDPSLAKRTDVLATAITAGMTVRELSDLDLTYAPPFAPVWDPILQAANKARFSVEKG
jgi:CoA-dependent NAD(P)H sulfur oxidoreductase